MTTDDLIISLSAELSPVRSTLLRRTVSLGLCAGLVASVAVFALFWSLRPDLSAIAERPFPAAKTILPAILGALALPVMLSRARPGGESGASSGLTAVPVLLSALVVLALVSHPPALWLREVLGHSVVTCLTSIPGLAAPTLGGLLIALRRGAPERPGLCGGLAGAVAGGFGAALYSLYCIEDSPLFYGVWYTLAIAATVVAGHMIGRRYLRW